MDNFAVGLTFVLVIVAILALALPLIRTRGAEEAAQPPDDLSDLGRLREARNTALTAILDLDDELARGNVSAAEHRASRPAYVERAAALIREIEGREQVLDEEIERAVRMRREANSSATPTPDDAEEPLA